MGTTKSPPRFKVAQWVSYAFGTTKVLAQVLEDRGPLGVGGRQLYRVRFYLDPEDAMTSEVPEVELDEVRPKATDIVAYLKRGKLIEILSHPGSNVWLTFDSRGNVIHTFSPVPGAVGGYPAPYALDEERILTSRSEKVAKFLQSSFELTEREAGEVVQSVGTSP